MFKCIKIIRCIFSIEAGIFNQSEEHMPINSVTIVFITGAFVSHLSWKPWMEYFQAKGFNCIAPPWPYKEGKPEELRKDENAKSKIASLRFNKLVDYFEDIVSKLPEKPVVIGHSIGGLIVQILVNRDLVRAGIAIHSVPPQGVFSLEWPLIKSMWKPLGIFTASKKTYLMSFKEWQYAFTNDMPEEEQFAAYEKYILPESKKLLRDTLTYASKIDFQKTHPPLLFIAGGNDNLVTSTLNYNNYAKYNKEHSVTDYKEFKDKNHFITGHLLWEDEAQYILSWLEVLP
ncbi:alpha/beta hydrolase [Flavobacterium rhizosphaerae]|uniref:Alpha/beta hydrolase n=1 Tax=Flavobacterium rhizosphaerae TaxID=3163298 RepID=A0ABW8YS07_9FLAO